MPERCKVLLDNGTSQPITPGEALTCLHEIYCVLLVWGTQAYQTLDDAERRAFEELVASGAVTSYIVARQKALIRTKLSFPDHWLITPPVVPPNGPICGADRRIIDSITCEMWPTILRLDAADEAARSRAMPDWEAREVRLSGWIGTAPLNPSAAGKGRFGKSVDRARQEAERHVQRNGFPGVRALADLIGCSPSTMCAAVRMSPILARQQAAHEAAKRKNRPRTVQLTPELLHCRPSADAMDPANAALLSEQESALSSCTPEEITRIEQMPPSDRNELLLLLTDQARDNECSQKRSRTFAKS